MHVRVWVSLIALKMSKVRLQDQARASIFTYHTCKYISLRLVLHILFDIKDDF